MSMSPNKLEVRRTIARVRGSAAFAIITSVVLGLLGTTLVSAAAAHGASQTTPHWTVQERALLKSLSLTSLEPLAPDPSNRFGDDPRAAALGEELFFDKRLSGNGKVSCATCHVPAKDFQDGTPLAHGVGTTARRTMPIAGTAHNAWYFWDGRASSQWEQALGPLESAVEHGGTRTEYARVIAEHYRGEYEATFGALPALTGLPRGAGPVADSTARASWVRIAPAQREEISRVYANIGKANCSNCHNGALLTDQHFHNTGVPLPRAASASDSGRAIGVRQALAGEFSCTSRYSDAKPDDCEELRFAVTEGAELVRAYKTASLRNVANHAPYMHAGQFATLDEVLAHYNRAPAAPFGKSELKPLHLSPIELRQLSAFLGTLTTPAAVPTGSRD